MKYNGSTYIYRKDVQGNIIALLDSNGRIVVKYAYDAWGNNTVYDSNGNINTDENFIGNINPFRYNVGASFSLINRTKQKLRFCVYAIRMRPLKLRKKCPCKQAFFLLVLRGYYYDTETKLYYLKSRYYDPEVGRFISVDGIEYLDPETINGLNLYAYCGNNPVMNVDSNGTSWWTDF